MEMKNEVLEMLKSFMMGEHGKKMKPAVVSVEMVHEKPEGSLKDALDEASEDAPEMDAEDSENDLSEDCDDNKKNRSLKDFFARK